MKAERIVSSFAKGTRVLVILSVLVGGTWLIARCTDWLDPPGGSSEPSSSLKQSRFRTTHSQIARQDIDARTRGKSVFRTSRQLKTQVVEEIGRYELQGISGRVGAFKAYFKDTKVRKTLKKRVGDSLGPFQIKEIVKGKVVLERSGEVYEFLR